MPADPPLPRWLSRIGVFDLETTGVDVHHDRIVTAHVGVLDAEGQEIAARTWLADPGVTIPDEAAAIHGVTTEYARREGRPSAEVVREITAAIDALLQQGVPIVAYNAAFDFSVLTHENARHDLPPLTNPGPLIDPLVMDKAFDRYRRGKRTLEVVAAHYSVTLDAAHEASADAIAAGRVAQAIARRFPLPPTPEELHTRQVGWARAQAESLTDYFISIGRLDPEDSLDGTWPVR